MSDETPKPNIPTPNTERSESAPPASAVETGATEKPVQPEAEVTKTESAAPATESLLVKRILGGLIDILVGAGLYLLAAMLLPDMMSKVAWALQIGYMLTRDALPFLNGRSLGKMAVGLRAVTTDGKPLTNDWKASAIRNIPFIIPVLPIVEIIVLFTRENDPKKGLRLGDDFANTKVIASQD